MRPSETMPLDIQNSRCGEIYVSNKADKWTFFCSYCQKGTSDIGVFICHIRLDHLSSMLDSETQKDNVASEEELQFPDTDCEAFDRASDHALDPNLIKEETISQFSYESESSPVPNKISKTVDISDRSETENKDSAKHSPSLASSTETPKEFIGLQPSQVNPEKDIEPNFEAAEVFQNKFHDSETEAKDNVLNQENQKLATNDNATNYGTLEICSIKAEDMEQVIENNDEIINNAGDENLPTASTSICQTHIMNSLEVCSIKSEEMEQVIECNKEMVNIDDDKNLPITSASIYQTHIMNSNTLDLLQQDDNTQYNKEDIEMANNDVVDDKACCSNSHEECLLYKCSICELKFVLEKHLRKHLSEIHNKTFNERRYECKKCFKKFRNLSGFIKYHLELIHKVSVDQENLRKHYFITSVFMEEQQHHLKTQFNM